MIGWEQFVVGHWRRLVRLVSPLQLGSALTADLADDFTSISQERGEQTAKRWLAGQLKSSAVAFLVDEWHKSPLALSATVVAGQILYVLLARAFALSLPDAGLFLRFALLLVLVPLILGWFAAFLMRDRELPAGMLSALAATLLLLGIEAARLTAGISLPSPLEGMPLAPLWVLVTGSGLVAGSALRKGQRVEQYRNREEGLLAAYEKVAHFEYSSVIKAPVETVFGFHERPDAIALLTPKWLFPRVSRLKGKGIEEGVELVITTLGVLPWHARHTAYVKNRIFVDEMVSGPMRSWRHEHHFLAQNSGTLLTDSIEFVPWGPVAPVLWGLNQLFRFRHAVTKRYCER